jgi:transcriptional regulator with XRE-family HTH domain
MVSCEELLRRRVQALLHMTGRTRKDLALYLGKQPSWATDYFHGRHGVTLKDLDRLARFFGVSVASLFEIDGVRFRERRRDERRKRWADRRTGAERRRDRP